MCVGQMNAQKFAEQEQARTREGHRETSNAFDVKQTRLDGPLLW